MKVAVIGGGPAGLCFASSLKRLDSAHSVTVFERSSRNSTYGFGIAFSDGALRSISSADPTLGDGIRAHAEHLPTVTIVHQNTAVSISGCDFYSVARLDLLKFMEARAVAVDVEIVHDRAISSTSDLRDFDLIVGADGINSGVRHEHEKAFRPEVTTCNNPMIWYGTDRTSDGISLIFQPTPFGLFVGHTYRYQNDRNTFVVECSIETWRASGLDGMSGDKSVAFCSTVFAGYLQGASLLSNRSSWFRPTLVWSRYWSHVNIGLIGDALKTLHPSVGSGTRAAMRDALSLARACQVHAADPLAALAMFEAEHKRVAEDLQQAARQSIGWYESVNERLHLSPLQLAFEYMTRTKKVDLDRLKQMDASFVAAWAAEEARRFSDPAKVLS